MVYAPVADSRSMAVAVPAAIPAEGAEPWPVSLTPANMGRVARVVHGQNYGWGGMFQNRDCSAMIRDLFAPFGIWLPRNSKGQARHGRVVDVSHLSGPAKESKILDEGEPFLTLVYMPGHIMLYIGRHQGRAAVLHNMWGVRTRDRWDRSGRNIVGRAVITTLQPGIELEDADLPRADLRRRVRSLVFVGREPDGAGDTP
jgi:hypothetical protein